MTHASAFSATVSAALLLGSLAAPGMASAQDAVPVVAGIHASPVENAWNSRLHAALQAADAAGTIDYVFSEGVAANDYPRVMREYAENGAVLIVGESFAAEAEARQVAGEYPDTAFLMGSSGEPAGENFGTFGTWNHESAYLAGMLAGRMTESGTVGSVGALPIPEINMLINAFQAGVTQTRPDARHLVSFIGTFFDPPRAREAGLAQIDAGADILFGERIGTADAAQERGIEAVGNLTDYSARYPQTVFANAVFNFDPILAAALEDKLAGEPTGEDYTPYSMMRAGGNEIVLGTVEIPAEALAEMEAKREEILAGTFEVPVDTSEPD